MSTDKHLPVDENDGDGEIRVRIDGEIYELPTDPDTYDLEEARALKHLTGLFLIDLRDGLRYDDPDYITFLVWAALHRKDPAITVDQVTKLNMADLFVRIMEAHTANLKAAADAAAAEAAEEQERPPDPPALSAAASGETEPPAELEPGPSAKSASESQTRSEELSPETDPETSGIPG